ncbi:hypothetical protein TWF506_007177 [Arthrobotrys conoides]|uniref:Uncharacterized protein n=1 Tax=Arthrobotrys conoides TaxID=74498 RepID=A0AAN8RXU0_9PEZI
MKSGRSSCPTSRTGTPSGTKGMQRAPKNGISSPPKSDTHRDERSRSQGRVSHNSCEDKGYISVFDLNFQAHDHPAKKSKEIDWNAENPPSPSASRFRRSREFTRDNNPGRLINYTVPSDSSKAIETSPLSTSQSSLVNTHSAAKDSKYVKKSKGTAFKSNGEFLNKTLDGMEQWLLKNESSFSAGDLAALSSEKEGSEGESPLEQLLNCALQMYHWGRTHGDSGSIVWKDQPSDVRKTFNSAILELGSNSSGKPNYKSQDELILRMRYNPPRSYSDWQPKGSIQDVLVQEYATLDEKSYATSLKSGVFPNLLVGDGTTANPYNRFAERKLPGSIHGWSALPTPPNSKSNGGKFWDLLSSFASNSDPQNPLHWYRRVVDSKTREVDDSFSSASNVNTQGYKKPVFCMGRKQLGGTNSVDSSTITSLSALRLNPMSDTFYSNSTTSTKGHAVAKSRSAQHFHNYNSSDDLNDDEELGKLSASLLYLVYLGLNYGGGYGSRPGSGSELASGSTGKYSTASGNHRNLPVPDNSSVSKSRQVNRGKKHGRGDSDDEDRGKGSEPPKRIKKLMNAREINQRLACPFAKGDPATYGRCIFVHRRDLPGVRLVKEHLSEHLKRNHFGGVVPIEIRQARTWSQIFLVCNPGWPADRPIPSPLYSSSQTNPISPAAFPLSTSTTFPSIGDPPQSITPVVPARTTPQRTFPSFSSSTQTPTRNFSLTTGLNETIGDLNNPFFVQSLAQQIPEVEDTEPLLPSDPTQYTISDLLSVDNLNEFLQDSIEWLNANTITNTHPQSVPDRRPASYEFPDTASISSSSSDIPVQILTPRSSHESLNDILVQDSEFDQWFKFPTSSNSRAPTVTPPVTIYKPSCGRERKYLLRVARKPALPKGTSSETSSSKKFYFDDMEEFKANFENWMKAQFYDPGFCWGLWELENPGRQERLSDMQAVVDELEFMLLAYRSNEAALFLVPKQFDGFGYEKII